MHKAKIKNIKKSAAQMFWLAQIANAEKREEKWRIKGNKILKRYRDDQTDRPNTTFNILWSNTEILKAATFSRVPQPNVTRRFKTDGEVERRTSELIERCLQFYSEESQFTDTLRMSRDDMLLPGRGTNWVQYNAAFEKIELEVQEQVFDLEDGTQDIQVQFMLEGEAFEPDGFDDEEAQTGPFIEELTTESVELQFVYWEDFLQSNSRSWEKTWWVARKHGMDRAELVDMFGEDNVRKIDSPQDRETDSEGNTREIFPVWEIWDKARKERIWFTDRANDTLEIEEPPLDLVNFFPCPKPIMPFETTDTMIPVPEFCIYQDQADELDVIVNRLTRLTKSLKAAGIYNAKNGETIDLSTYRDGQLVPVNMAEFGADGKLSDQIQYLPLIEIAGVIERLEARKAIIKAEIFEITGISDIIRGATDPNETATAQRLKGSFGSLRLRPRREPIEEMIRDVYRIMAEVISDKFSPQTIQAITGMEVTPEIQAFMRNDTLRAFRIDVETDSTVQPNQEIDKRNAAEFLTVMGSFLQQAIPSAQAVPELAPLMGAMIKHAAQNFKAGRVLEGLIDESMDKLIEGAKKQKKDPEGPTPEQQIEAQKLQIEQATVQNETKRLELDERQQQIDLQKIQADLILAQQNNETDLLQDQIRSGAQVDTAIIEQQTSDNDNQTKLIIEGLKATQGQIQ